MKKASRTVWPGVGMAIILVANMVMMARREAWGMVVFFGVLLAICMFWILAE